MNRGVSFTSPPVSSEMRRAKSADTARNKKDVEQARQEVREADARPRSLAEQQRPREETDFYPYRYLGSQAFIPGYNFPRLPVRALLEIGDETETIDRPRFLGLSEFGPNNIIYHEGRRHQVTGLMLGAGGWRDSHGQRAGFASIAATSHREGEVTNSHCALLRDRTAPEIPTSQASCSRWQ